MERGKESLDERDERREGDGREEEQVEINNWVTEEREEEEQVEKIDRVVESSPYEPPPLSFPPGVRFHPKDHELIQDYLLLKLQDKPLPYNIFKDVNLYDYNPEDLTAKYCSGDELWYFFTPRDRKYKNGSRPSRSAGGGYWKATGKDKSIFSNEKVVGTRKVLVFYRGHPPNGTKTNWVMHEFRINETRFEGTSSKLNRSSMRLDNWVLCRIFENARNDRVQKEPPISCPQDHETESHNACPQDEENEASQNACQQDHENEAPIACPQDQENGYPFACTQDYESQFPIARRQDGEQIKIAKEESSHCNKISTSEVASEIFDCSFMPTSLPNDSVGLNISSYSACSNSTLDQFDAGIRDQVENMNLQLENLKRHLASLTG